MSCTADTHCITCSDEGVPMVVVAPAAEGIARCEVDGAGHEVMTDLVGPVTAGEKLLVHAGVALARLE